MSLLRQRQPAFISVLPVEILAYIFELGSPTSYEWRTTEYPLIIASVCRIWRNVALHVATTIWSTITISISRLLNIPLLYIERSGESPLKLFFVAAPDVFSAAPHRAIKLKHDVSLFPQAIRILHKYIHRWHVLKFLCTEHEFSVVMSSLYHARLPKLQTLTVECVNTDHSPLISIFEADGAPNLSSLDLYNIPNMHPQPSLSSVTNLELRGCGFSMTYIDMSSFLQSFRHLLRLIFIESGPNSSENEDRILLPDLLALDFGSGFHSLEVFSLQTPSLRTLKLSASGARSLPGLLLSSRYPRPSVETFIISGSLRISSDIADILQAFPNIKHLVFHQTGMGAIFKLLHSTIQRDHGWQSLETLTISPWSNGRCGKWIEEIGNQDRMGPGRLFERIQLDVDDDSQMSVELHDAFKALAKHIEILPPHTDPADISSVVRDLSRGDEASFLLQRR